MIFQVMALFSEETEEADQKILNEILVRLTELPSFYDMQLDSDFKQTERQESEEPQNQPPEQHHEEHSNIVEHPNMLEQPLFGGQLHPLEEPVPQQDTSMEEEQEDQQEDDDNDNDEEEADNDDNENDNENDNEEESDDEEDERREQQEQQRAERLRQQQRKEDQMVQQKAENEQFYIRIDTQEIEKEFEKSLAYYLLNHVASQNIQYLKAMTPESLVKEDETIKPTPPTILLQHIQRNILQDASTYFHDKNKATKILSIYTNLLLGHARQLLSLAHEVNAKLPKEDANKNKFDIRVANILKNSLLHHLVHPLCIGLCLLLSRSHLDSFCMQILEQLHELILMMDYANANYDESIATEQAYLQKIDTSSQYVHGLEVESPHK
jgi:hypothetical protein